MSRKRRTVADEAHVVIRSAVAEPGRGRLIAPHAHDWHQLIHVCAGLITVWTETGSWMAPPGWAVWAPAGVAHGIRFAASSAFRTLYVRPLARDGLPARSMAMTVSPLLRELIVRTTQVGMLDPRDLTEQAMITLLLAELRPSDTPAFDLPRPTSGPMRRAAGLIEVGAPEAESTRHLAGAVGVSPRALERRFAAETGLSPGRWRQQHVLLGALEQIAAGRPVKSVAVDAGYASSSAFIAAFRKSFGITPARYFLDGAAASSAR
jgi:AraC-like DNA-binding protein/quercetin dioxygenase-like cupin family protein